MNLTPKKIAEDLKFKKSVSDVVVGTRIMGPGSSVFEVISKEFIANGIYELGLKDSYETIYKLISDNPIDSELDCQWV